MRKMDSAIKTVEKAVEKAARGEVKRSEGWPPDCSGVLHQPKRPKRK